MKKVFSCFVLFASTFCIVALEKEAITFRQYKQSSRFALLDADYDRKKIVVNKIVDNVASRYITYIIDGEKNQYIIKQKRSGGTRKQFQVVFEKLSAHIAEILKIPAHRVQILPAGMTFPGKVMTERAASILTLVPGIPVKQIKSGPYSEIDLRQSNRPDWPKEALGLNKKVIASMMLHTDLPLIAALDTFVGIKGRSPGNYFYDKETDHFYMIDMDKAYNTNDQKELISKIACDQVRIMLGAKKVFRTGELQGLRLYKDTLQQLVALFPPARIYELMDEFSLASGFKKTYLPEIESRVNRIKINIEKSHHHIIELIDLVSQLIDSSKK